MPAFETELGRAFRRMMAGVERAPGDSVPETLGNQALPVASTADAQRSNRIQSGRSTTYADSDDTGPAHRNAPNSFGNRVQDRLEIKAHRETFVDLGTIDVGGTATLDPNIASNFIVRASGNMTIAVAAPAAVTDPNAPAPSYLYGVKVWVKRPSGAKLTWTGVLWSQDVLDPNGDGDQKDSLLGAATKAGHDSYVLVFIPGFGTFGYLAGRGFPESAT